MTEQINQLTTYRTQGDGMEIEKSSLVAYVAMDEHSLRKTSNSKAFDKLIYRPVKHCRLHLRPNRQIIPVKQAVPKLVKKEKKKSSFSYAKEPRFVPREPFKAAVTPILSHKKVKKNKSSKNNVDIQILVSQMTNLASSELKNSTINSNSSSKRDEKTIKQSSDLVLENQRLENEIRTLKDTNEQLEKQLRFQTQVNSELKTLLVAAVGEDLEARVQLLTEDKLQLARALLNSAQHLSTHREQVEWLAGHCEVWRSKFLASSLMVDELARWKSVLTNQIAELQEAIKCLLEEHNQINVDALKVWETLSTVATKCNIQYEKPKAMHVVAVIKACEDIAFKFALYLLGSSFIPFEKALKKIEINTPGEVLAQQALTRTNSKDNPNSAYNVLLSKSKKRSFCLHCNQRNSTQDVE